MPALLAAFPAASAAQHFGPTHFAGTTNFRGSHFHRGGFPAAYSPLGLFDYADYFAQPGYARSSQPEVIVLQSPQPAPAAEPASPPAQPLMIELQGDRYVQISGDQPSASQTIKPPVTASATSSRTTLAAASSQVSTAVLIFRDGHREEVAGYTITDGRLYVTSNYSTTGFWIQKIELSALNLPETIAANNASGHQFQIPSAPNEVVVGP